MAMEVSTGRRWLLPVSLPSSTHLQQHASPAAFPPFYPSSRYRLIASLHLPSLTLLCLLSSSRQCQFLAWAATSPKKSTLSSVLSIQTARARSPSEYYGRGIETFPLHLLAALASCCTCPPQLPAAPACCTCLLHPPHLPAALACCTCLLTLDPHTYYLKLLPDRYLTVT